MSLLILPLPALRYAWYIDISVAITYWVSATLRITPIIRRAVIFDEFAPAETLIDFDAMCRRLLGLYSALTTTRDTLAYHAQFSPCLQIRLSTPHISLAIIAAPTFRSIWYLMRAMHYGCCFRWWLNGFILYFHHTLLSMIDNKCVNTEAMKKGFLGALAERIARLAQHKPWQYQHYLSRLCYFTNILTY